VDGFEGKIANLIGTPVKADDSGAWICSPVEEGKSWCGMVIGGYDQTSYAISAEKILGWITEKARLTLELIK